VATRDELARYIRFQLGQLGAKNAHHEFEHIARHFSRLRITERIVPATGPVGAGGDAGRDFETFRTYLAGTPIAGSTFLASAANKTLVFACSLEKTIEAKIKADLVEICGGGQRVDEVYYFCEPDLAIGKRNKLREHSRTKHGVELTIFDGQALSENLIEADVFWIAQEYLGVPAEIYPKALETDDKYEAARRKWLTEGRKAVTFSDFTEIKAGLRNATFNKGHRADLPPWLDLMRAFVDGQVVSLRRRAIYEVCVAALRGMDNLSSHQALVVQYFSSIGELDEFVDLRDATVLLTYCSAAAGQGHFDMDGSTLHRYTEALIQNLETHLRGSPPIGLRCELLEIRGMAEALWFRASDKRKLSPGRMLALWGEMLKLVPSAPLFPLESFADILTVLAPHFAGNDKFERLTQQTDKLLEKRTSGHVAADKCRDRAIAYLDNDKVLYAIRQLHIAKVKWFSAETLRGSILSMLILSDCYLRLGLNFAAKYYSAAAAVLAHSANNDEIKPLVPGAFRAYFSACYAGGEWFTCMVFAKWLFAAHNAFDPDAYQFEKDDRFSSVVYNLTVLRHLSKKFASPSLDSKLEQLVGEWPIHTDVREMLADFLKRAEETFEKIDQTTALQRMQSELWGRPFLDLGRERTVRFRALGILWTVRFENERETVAVCEEFLAILQIVLAELSMKDLVLLPTTVSVEIFLTPRDTIVTEELPNNEQSTWRVGLPIALAKLGRHASDLMPQVVAVASIMLGKCSTLSKEQFHSRLHQAVKGGLFSKTAVVRPYAQIYLDMVPSDDFEGSVRTRFDPLFARAAFAIREAKELAWQAGDGPGYSKERSEELISNRYRNALRCVRVSLPGIVADPAVGPKLQALRVKGMKDWEILNMLANCAANYRVDQMRPASLEERKRLMRRVIAAEEDRASPRIPPSLFSDEVIKMQLLIGVAAVAKTWGLHLHWLTPDFVALRRLLESRYHISTDDVEHDDFLG
jgi:hypothetical protein